nr:protein ALP1-like [Halyomorpha halys]
MFDDLSDVIYAVPFLRGSVLKSTHWRSSVLPNLDEDRFKSLLKVNYFQFKIIIQEIKDDSVFNCKHSAKQLSVELQLAIVLYRLGCSGEGASIRKNANLFGCGDGGTINIITKRVFIAILSKRHKFIFWPSEAERNEIISNTLDELPHCIGKQQFSLKAQIVCDYKLQIRHFICGFPGSVHDQRIFNYSSIDKKSSNYFSGMQWIAGDTAYALKPYVLSPFKTPPGGNLTERQKKFNAHFSKYRVRVEHTLGIIKEKFNSLKELKIRISNKESIKFACAWFSVCCILHNILRPTEEQLFAEEILTNDEVEDEDPETHQDDNISGHAKRNALFENFQ